jgi:glycolate oxidase FAD binding subunit
MSSDSNAATRSFEEVVQELGTADAHAFPVDELIPRHVVRPSSVAELSEVVRSANLDGLSIISWGGGSQMGFGNLPERYDVAVDLTGIDEVLRYDPDDMTMSVQAGCRVLDLNEMLGEHRQVLPVDAASPSKATIGGLTAVGVSGPRRLGYGPLRDLIIGMSVMSVDGVVAKAGGQVVKNVTGFDMMRLHHGALGALGIIISVNLKVIPKPQSERTVVATFKTLDQVDAAAKAVVQSQLGVTALVITNPGASSETTGVNDGLWAIAARCEAPPSAVVRQAERVTEFIHSDAESVLTEESTEESEGRWDSICQALDQRGDSPDLAVRLGIAPSKLATVGNTLQEVVADHGGRVTLDYGSGLAYVRVSRDKVSDAQLSSFYGSIVSHGDHAAAMTAPVSLKRNVDVFGGPAAGFSMIEALKTTFDPNRILNAGRSIGRI